jgi:hypothetical protein
MWGKCRTKDPHFGSGLNPALTWCFRLGSSELVMFLYASCEKTAIAVLKTGASVQKFIAWAARQLGFVHL